MSNLLDQASIVLTPTAYDNGKVLCAKPTDGSGDFDFSRNSAATRVNAQGLVEDVQILSSNLVQNGDFSQTGSEEITNGNFSQQGSQLITNGDFATDSNWTLISGVTYNVGGYLDFDGSQGTGSVTNTPNTTFTLNKTYKVVYEIKDYISGTIKFRFQGGSNTIGQQQSGDGVKTEYIVCNDSSNNKFNFFGSSSFNGSIDNVSVVEVGQDWTIEDTWTIGEGVANGNGANGSTAELKQTSVNTIGKSYKATFKVLNYVSGSVGFFRGSGIGVTPRTADGVYTEYFTATSSEIRFRGSNFNGSITNISVKEVGQNWFKDANWSIGDNVATSTGAGRMFQSISALEGNTGTKVKVSFNITEVTSGGVKVDCYGAASSVITEVGTHTFTGTTTNSLNLYINNSGTGNLVGSITNISVIEITDDTNLPRINYEGFSFQDALGSELVLNGDFDTDSDWNLGGSDTPIIENGFLKFGISDGTYSRARQDNASIVGDCKVTYTVVNSSASTLSIREYSGGNSESVPATIGTHTIYKNFTANGVSFQAGGVDGGILEIDNISIKEVLGKEVVPDSGCGNWLWEPQTTSLVTYSEDFTQWASLGGTVTYVSDLVNPDGSLGGYKISGSGIYLALNLLSTTERNIYARTVSGTGTAQLLSHNTNTNNAFSLTEDWKRFDINSSPASAVANFYIDLRGAASTLTELYVWGANATNDQDYPTSYIPADGTSVTRNQDVCNNGGSVSTINSTSGVLYAEIAALANENVQRILSISDGTHNNTVKLGFLNSATDYRLFADIRLGGVNQAFLTFNFGAVAPTFKKCAIKYKQNDFALWIDGVEVATDTSGNTFSANTLNELTFTRGDAAQNFFGETKCLAVWKEALTDTQLAELTTI